MDIARRVAALEKKIGVRDGPFDLRELYDENLMGTAVMYFHGRAQGSPPSAFFQGHSPEQRELLQGLFERPWKGGISE